MYSEIKKTVVIKLLNLPNVTILEHENEVDFLQNTKHGDDTVPPAFFFLIEMEPRIDENTLLALPCFVFCAFSWELLERGGLKCLIYSK